MPTTYAIPDGRTVMAATLYTGTGSALTISNAVNGVSFQPDFIWIKPRNIIGNNGLFDSVRGFTQSVRSNQTRAEDTSPSGFDLTAFNSNGFSVGPSNYIDTSTNGATVVAWNWKAGGTAVSNTAGSITSSVSANTTAGFSVVTYTGNSTNNATVGHGLGVVPSMIILKNRSGAYDWPCYHISIGSGGYIYLNQTATAATDANMWKTTPTSTVFTLGTYTENNGSSNNYVAYCFAAVAGYSAFGSYIANASADGPFIYTGFRPRWIMLKRSSAAGAPWSMFDTSRNTYNSTNLELDANVSSAESTSGNGMDILSNGFKLRDSAYLNSSSGDTFIYACFAENPFKYANAR